VQILILSYYIVSYDWPVVRRRQSRRLWGRVWSSVRQTSTSVWPCVAEYVPPPAQKSSSAADVYSHHHKVTALIGLLTITKGAHIAVQLRKTGLFQNIEANTNIF